MKVGETPVRLVRTAPRERPVKLVALCIAVAIHVIALLVNLPALTNRKPP